MDSVKIKIGSLIGWSGAWNSRPISLARVEKICHIDSPMTLDGKELDSVEYRDKENCTFTLDNGHWCYGYQIHYVVKE